MSSHSKPTTTKTPLLLLTLLHHHSNSIPTLKQIHTQLLTTSTPNPHNHLLSKALHLRDLPYSSLLFSHHPNPNPYSFNVLIRALATTFSKPSLALQFYHQMRNSGLKPDKFTYPFVLIAVSTLRWGGGGRMVHAVVFKSGLRSNPHTQHSLITMYAKCGALGCARKVFDEIGDRDCVSWNSMISGYARVGLAKEAVGLFGRMRVEGCQPDEMTVVSVLTACRDMGDLELGRELEVFVEDNGFELTSYVGSALIDMYGKCGDLEAARRVFERMPRKYRVAWNAMITGYAQNGLSDEAIALFKDMSQTETKPDEITMVGVLSACASVGALDIGKSVDMLASQKGLLEDVYVGTALIDMYAKCGNLDRATEIFQCMPSKNVVTWNAMISALAFHGRAADALTLFRRMKDEERNVHPDELTFIGVLSACVHAGLVEEARKWFNYMTSNLKISPRIEHYSCMVDLLARTGCVEEAWAFIERMPGKPDAIMLGALLSASRNCKNATIGERVSKLLLEIEPMNSGNYVISSKIYAGSKRWDASAKMRGLMRDRGVVKTPGCSWIEILNQLHEFRSGDPLHLTFPRIHQIFDVLHAELKKEGYVPNLE